MGTTEEGGMTDNRNEPIRLDRLSDRFFKYLFATEEHKDLLIALSSKPKPWGFVST